MKFHIVAIMSCLVLGTLASTSQEEELIEKWSATRKILLILQKSGGSVVDYKQNLEIEKDVAAESMARAFGDPKYDSPDSFLAALLRTPSISLTAVSKVCRLQFPKAPVDNGERSRLCNYMIQTLYENRPTISNYCDGIRMILLENEYSGIYSDHTKAIIKRIIMNNNLHFAYLSFIEYDTDPDLRKYLFDIMRKAEKGKIRSFIESWFATCMLAKSGDKETRKKVTDMASGMSDIRKAMYVPLGLAYIGDKEMIESLFVMLKSDLRKWNGEDVEPQETQLAHEAAMALALCVKDFPSVKSYENFTSRDRDNCLQWVESHRTTFVIKNKPPHYYLKETLFKELK